MVVHLFLHLCQHGCIYGWCVVVLCISLPTNTVIFHIIRHLFFENGLLSSPPHQSCNIFLLDPLSLLDQHLLLDEQLANVFHSLLDVSSLLYPIV